VRTYLLTIWLPAVKATVRQITYATYKTLCTQHIIVELGSMQLRHLTGARINAVYAKLLEKGKVHGEGALSPASVRRVHACLHRALRDAVRWEYLAINPVDAADPPRERSEHRKLPAWNSGQLIAFLTFMKNDRLFALWRLLAMTGCRRGDALGLRWENVDMHAGTITICQALVPVGKQVVISEPKTSRGRRTIALDPVTLEALKAHAARQADEQSEWGEAWTDTGYVFVHEDGQPLHPERTPGRLSGICWRQRPEELR